MSNIAALHFCHDSPAPEVEPVHYEIGVLRTSDVRRAQTPPPKANWLPQDGARIAQRLESPRTRVACERFLRNHGDWRPRHCSRRAAERRGHSRRASILVGPNSARASTGRQSSPCRSIRYLSKRRPDVAGRYSRRSDAKAEHRLVVCASRGVALRFLFSGQNVRWPHRLKVRVPDQGAASAAST
jgi:hypothetical protein